MAEVTWIAGKWGSAGPGIPRGIGEGPRLHLADATAAQAHAGAQGGAAQVELEAARIAQRVDVHRHVLAGVVRAHLVDACVAQG